MKQVFKFGPFEASLAERRLLQEARPVPLTPKVFHILEVLIRNRERIVSKQELMDEVWPNCHVDESNLTQSVSVLRKALGETSAATKYIATFPKMGYRLIADVEEVQSGEAPDSPAPPALEAPSPSKRRPGSGSRRIGWATVGLLPVALLAIAQFSRKAAGVEPLGGLTAITHLAGRAFQPALSPDGARVAFVSHQTLAGPLRIGVLDLPVASAPLMLDTGDGDAFSPAWSPDGGRIAYLRAHDGRVSVVLQQPGGKPEDLTGIFPESCSVVARRLDWSPDGSLLAVSAKRAANEPFRIELIHIAEKRRTVLTSPPELSDGDFQPRFSPDGTRLAFVRQRSIANMELLFVPIPGGDPVALTADKQSCGDVDWAPDSRAVIFTPLNSGKSRIRRLDLAPGGSSRTWAPLGALADGFLQFSVSRKTGTMVLARAQSDQNIWRANLDSAQGITGWDRLIASTGEDSFPVYSPDSRRIAFLSDRSGDQQLWIKEESAPERQITFEQLKPGAASWTAGGDTIVFPSLRRRVLYRMKLDGKGPEAIPVEDDVGAHTAVSPDGGVVYLAHRFLLMRAPISGGKPAQLTDRGGYPLRVSPDGKWIYYAQHRYSDEIWRLRIDDGFTERLTNRLRAGCWACWSVNANALVYVAAGSSGARLERLDLASGRTRDLGLLPGRLPPLGLGMLALSPDDRALLAVVAETGTGDLQILTQGTGSDAIGLAARH